MATTTDMVGLSLDTAQQIVRQEDPGVRLIRRLEQGEGAYNFYATNASDPRLVKIYRDKQEGLREERVAKLSRRLVVTGLPTPKPVLGADGRYVRNSGPWAYTVWEWIEGVTHPFMNRRRAASAATTLAALHSILRSLFGVSASAQKSLEWLTQDGEEVTLRLESLMSRATSGHHSPDCERGCELVPALERRLRDLGQLTPLLEGLPELQSQVIHGDYGPPNLVFVKDNLNGVIDFGDPDPFLLSWELGRLAIYPTLSLTDAQWRDNVRTVIQHYVAYAEPGTEFDIIYSARVGLIQLLGSLYGASGHFGEGLFPSTLYEFWMARDRVVRLLLNEIDGVEDFARKCLHERAKRF